MTQAEGLTTLEAEALYRRAESGDPDAFWSLVTPHEGKVHAVAYGMTRDVERARDIAHDTFLRAFSTLGNLRSPAKVGSWLCSMARNIAREQGRREMRHDKAVAQAPEAPVIPISDVMIEAQEFEHLSLVLESLPEPHRVVLSMKYMDDLSCKEIADALEIGVEAAKSRLFEARRLVKLRMEELHSKDPDRALRAKPRRRQST